MTDAPIADRLKALLEAERRALLEGSFDKLSDLMEEKRSLAEVLEDEPLQSEEVAPIRDGLRRNQELFDQAMAGIRNVAARLGDLNRVRRATDTYDARGQRQTIDSRPPSGWSAELEDLRQIPGNDAEGISGPLGLKGQFGPAPQRVAQPGKPPACMRQKGVRNAVRGSCNRRKAPFEKQGRPNV